jgi:hypothetical protein
MEMHGPGRSGPTGAVAVVVDDEARGEAHGLADLPGRQGRPQRGDDVGDTGLIERGKVRVALDEEDRAFLPDGVLGEIEPVEELALGVERRFRRIQVLGLGVEDRPAAEGDDPAGQAEDGEDNAAAEAVSELARPRTRQGQPALFEEGHRDVFGSEKIDQRRPGVRGVADLEGLDGLVRKAALLQISKGPLALRRTGEVLAEKAQGELVDLEQLLLELEDLGPDTLMGRQRDVIALGQALERLGEGQVLALHEEREDVAARAAAEAVVELFVLIDGKGGGFLGVERAQPDPFSPPPLQGGVLRGDLDDGRGLPDLVNDLHIKSWACVFL